MVYSDDKKKKMQFWICHERHVFIATQIRLHSCYWVSQSLCSWLSILPLVIWQKNKKAQWMHQLYILLKYGDSATKQKLYDQIGVKVVIIAKLIYSVKVKMCQFICNAQIHTHIYLNWYTVWCPWQSKAAGWQLKKGYFESRVNLMPVLLLWLPT